MSCWKTIPAKALRHQDRLLAITTNPGLYRWWAKTESVKQLLNSKYLDEKYTRLLKHLTIGTDELQSYHLIYVGISKSLRMRLGWHVNQRHRDSSVKSGYLSTFRQTLSSLLSKNQYDEKTTDKFINGLVIEYQENPSHKKVEVMEQEQIQEHHLPLNLRGNDDQLFKKFLTELHRLRKISK